MQIVKRDGSTREHSVTELFAGVGGLCDAFSEKAQEVCENITQLIDRIVKAMLEAFERILTINPADYILPIVIHYEPVLCVPSIKHIVIAFLEHASVMRKLFLVTKHHRGNTDDTCICF